jgi:RNA polymerase sigma factor (sigma-70 family)
MAIETLGAALRQINRLFVEGVVAGFSDAQLLERFLTHGDAGAFEALVARHGPMVLSVCRGVLRDPHAAEDAFQATFLVLVKKGCTIRGRGSLGGWLHQVAHRVAVQANIAAARRRALERQAGQMAVTTSTSGPAESDDLLPALHEEIARLPEKLRLAVVHCDLEGMTQAQAAGQLHWSERTLQHRLAEGRARLKRRLARRGLAPNGAALGAVFLREARAAVPAAWSDATVRAAIATVNHTMTVGVVSAAATQLAQEVFKVMLLQKLKLTSVTLLATGLIVWGASAALVSIGQEAPKGAATVPGALAARPTAENAVSQPKPASADANATFPVRGRVLDPDGKPVAGAIVHVRRHVEYGWSTGLPAPDRQPEPAAVTDADGRFHFELDKAPGEVTSEDVPRWHLAKIVAAAPGFAPAWVEAGDLVKGGEATLRLVNDDVPIRGRVLDSQGRPVAGVVIRIRVIGAVKDGVDLDAMLASGALAADKVAGLYGLDLLGPPREAQTAPVWTGGRDAWTTGADGQFEVRGVGRDRIARLSFYGGGVADGSLDVMARAAKTPPKAPHARQQDALMFGKEGAFMGTYPQGTQLVGATFDYIGSPTKPITGVLRLKGSGKPVAGAVVRAADPATHTSVTARTDATGRFRLDGVPKGAFYQLRFNPRAGIDPFLAHTEILDDTEGLKPIETTIEVPPGVIVTGRLIDNATRRTVPPADVRYIKAPDNVGVGNAPMGFARLPDAAFAITVPPGHAMIAATAAVSTKDDPFACARLKATDRGKGIGGFGDAETFRFPLSGSHTYQFVTVPAGTEPFAVELELTRGDSRKGSVVGPTGKPVTGARAYGLTGRWGQVLTIDADSFELHGLERGHPRLVLFTHQDLRLVGSLLLKDDDTKSEAPLVVHMERAGSVKGRLVDEDGQPLSGTKLAAMTIDSDGMNLPPGSDALWPDNETLTSDADGRFQVDGLKQYAKTTIFLTAPGTRPNARLSTGDVLKNLTAEPGQVRDLGDVKVKAVAE